MGVCRSKQVTPKEKETDKGQENQGTLTNRQENSTSVRSTDRRRQFDENSRRKGTIIQVSAATQEKISTVPSDWSIHGAHQTHGFLEHKIHIPSSNGSEQAEQNRSYQSRTASRDQDNVDNVDWNVHHKTSINQNMLERDKTAEVNKDLLQQLQRLKIEIKEIRFERDKMAEVNKELIGQKSRLESQLYQLERELNEMRIRLSRIASNSLTDNNPNIADLSDQNRPTKLADRFQELYCNEWSGAYEDLTKTLKKTEKQAVQILLDLIKNIYIICLETSERQENDLKSQIIVYTGNSEFSSELSQAMRPFKDKRKKMFQNFLPGISQEIKRRDSGKNGTLEHSKKIQRYIDLSTELCWLMCIQDPKVHLYTDCREGAAFDEANFSAYTVRGTIVDFLVWPSLHLHKGGALLKKGVAQGKGGGQTRR